MDKNQVTILIVDDNPTNLNVLYDYLTQSEYHVVTAKSSEHMFRQLGRIRPDLILLDVMMPGIDGFQACRKLKENPQTADIPVIFITALTDAQDKVKGFDAGGVDYITKPFYKEEVQARVRNHLHIIRLQNQLQLQNHQLQQQNQQLQVLNTNKDRFFEIIGHDLKNALASLRILGELLARADDLPTPKIQELGQRLRHVVNNTLKLLGNLLDWAKLNRGEMQCQPENTYLKPLIIANIRLIQENAQQKNINLTYHLDDNISIFADPQMIDTVIRNLLSNAIKYTPEGGKILIESYLDENQVKVAVHDTGVGISPENLTKLFRLDHKLQTPGTNKETGTGLGLLLCKEMIERNHGRIEIQSQENKGTTFAFTVPKSESSIPRTAISLDIKLPLH